MSEIPSALLAQIVAAQSASDSVARLREIESSLSKSINLNSGETYLWGMVLGLLKEYEPAIKVLSQIKDGDGQGLYRAAQMDIMVFKMASEGGGSSS
jgi:hypothetical protein